MIKYIKEKNIRGKILKNKKNSIKWICIIIILILVFICVVERKNIYNNIIKKSDIKPELEENYEKLQIYDNTQEDIKAIFIAKETKGIEFIEYSNGEKINGDNKTEVGIDCIVKKGNTYTFKVRLTNGEEKEKSFEITDELIEQTCAQINNNSEIDKEKKITINNNSIINNNSRIYYKIRRK